MGIKVLFLYPNTYGMNMLPPAIALFASILKKEGHQVEIFDTTYYSIDYGIDSDGSKVDKLNVVPYSMEKKGIEKKTSSWQDDIHKLLNNFRPDVIAISSTEDMWELGMQILDEMKDYKVKNKLKRAFLRSYHFTYDEMCYYYKINKHHEKYKNLKKKIPSYIIKTIFNFIIFRINKSINFFSMIKAFYDFNKLIKK